MFDISPILIGPRNKKTNVKKIKITNGIKINIYSPLYVKGNLPTIIYYHGGGWILGSLKAYERILKFICNNTGYVVVGIDYKKAPEYKFPVAFNDAFEGYKWIINNAKLFNIDEYKIAILGDSAGGNIAMYISNKINIRNYSKPKALGLIYPFIDISTSTLNEIKDINFFGKISYFVIQYILEQFIANPKDRNSVKISHLLNFKEFKIPNTLIIIAGIDPLKNSNEKFYKKLKLLNINIKKLYYKNSIHGFINFAGISKNGNDALIKLCVYLKQNLN